MSDDAFQTVNRAAAQVSVTTAPRPASLAIAEVASLSDALLRRRRAFRLTRHVVDFLLFLSLFVVAYTAVWEYSTRRYLKGFSDAIIPLSVSPEQKIQAILDWMSASGAQLTPGFVRQPSDRDPVDTLNYQALLKICGTATNAFINLADSGGLSARRLLLLNADQYAKHVDAEVLLNGRWVVVDPAFRRILRGSDGKTLTRDQLADPAVFAAATRNILHYDPNYSFENTAHVRMARIELVGAALQKVLHSVVPAWENSAAVSLILERESLAAMVIAVLIAVFLVLVRISLRWYGEKYLHIYSVRMRQQLRSAFQAFLSLAS